jgi:hypothetical protein
MNELNEIATALSKLQGEIINATKDKAGYNYSYADLAQILDISRPLMSKHELSLTQMPTTNSEGKIGITSLLMHSSGQSITSFFELPIDGVAKMSTAQACGSVITYMRRYALASILGIAQTDEDAATQEVKRINKSINEDELKEAIKSIRECSTMEELHGIWMNLDANIRTKATHEKDSKKKELDNAQQ